MVRIRDFGSYDSDQALAPLFERVAHKAFRAKRNLTREDFRVVFDAATRESVPRTEIAMLRQLSAQFTLGQSSISPLATMGEITIRTKLPPLPTPCCPRRSLLENLRTVLTRHRFLALSGSTGKGKSTLAKLVAIDQGGEWL